MNVFRNLKVGSKILSGYCVILVLMIVTAVYFISENNIAVEKFVILVEHDAPVVENSETLKALLLDMQSSFRGFVITGKDNFIGHYTEAKSKFHEVISDTRKLVADQPQQVALLDEIRRIMDNWIKTVAEPGILNRRNVEKTQLEGQHFISEFSALLSTGKNLIEDARTKLSAFSRVQKEATVRNSKEAAVANYRLNYLLIGLNLAVILIAVFFGLFTARSIQGPIRQLTDQMGLLARGGADLSFRMSAESRDEIGDLGRHFNQFLDSLGKMVARIADGSVKLASASAELKASGLEMSRGSESQLNQVLKTSSAMEEMSSSIQEVSKNAKVTADSAIAASSLAREGSEKLRTTLVGIEAVDESIRKLNLRTQEIGRVVQLIGGIAAQTNILALNAAIEAARAGEHGRGFDVVAEEIRKLALRTTESTGEISGVIEEIQQETGHAAKMMETGAHMAREAGQTLNDIVEGIVSTTDMVGMISSAAGQQAKTAEEIADAFQKIAQVSQQSAESSKESARAMVDLVDLSNQLREITEQFKI
jgi:methyl-accepting chemotaxis protein